MQKFLKIAEQYVQWFALGLGALYLLFMGWSYVYKSDINVSMGPKTAVEPGEIDATIAKGPIADLENKMANADPITITCPNVLAGWTDVASETAVDFRPLHGVWISNPYGENGEYGPGIAVGPSQAPIDKLPQIPAAIPVAVAAYRTLVQVPDPAFVIPPGGDPNAQAPLVNKDIDAASVQFKIDMKALAKAFTAAFPAGAPPAVFQTMYLKVTLLRQEWDAAGNKWGAPTEVPRLSINISPDDPGYPGDEPTQAKGLGYEYYAGAHQELILHPPFYPTAPGAPPWTMPQPAADAAGTAGAAAPGAIAPAGGFQRGGWPGGPQGGIGNPGYGRPNPPITNQPPVFDQPAPGGNGGWQGQIFNPVIKATDEILIAHDDTVEPEKTYRYYIQYRLLNPVFAAQRLAAKPELTKQFALISPGPDNATPTDKLTIPSRTQVFVKVVHNSSEAHFAVFVFSPEPKETEVAAAPGDAIAPTHWTLVDIRKSENPTSLSDYDVLLVDDSGNMQVRDWHTDNADPAQKDLHDRASAAAAAVPGTAVPGGLAPPIQ
jgi:hypothetical protein